MSPRVSLQGHTNEWRGLTTTLSATESWWQIKDNRDTETRILLSQTEYEIRSFLPSSRWLLSYLLVLQVTAVCSWPRSVSDCHLTAGHFPTHILPMCQTEESWCTQLLPAWMSTISQDPSLLKPSSHRPKTEAWKFILKSKLFPPVTVARSSGSSTCPVFLCYKLSFHHCCFGSHTSHLWPHPSPS